jgi:hypothetical protein
MQYKKTKSRKKQENFTLYSSILLCCGIVVATSIAFPFYYHKSKQEATDKAFYTNRVANSEPVTREYAPFWNRYAVVLKQRADNDGNKIISVQEKLAFDTIFFGDLNLTVEPTTKIITKSDGTNPTLDGLLCHLNSFYPDKPWISPVCPIL